MKIIKPSYEIIGKDQISGEDILHRIEEVGRTCYKSESNITAESAKKFVEKLISNGHEAMIEHNSISVRFVCDRGVSHELVRHRLASFGQESTRYCNYSKDKFGSELTFILPSWFEYGCSTYEEYNRNIHEGTGKDSSHINDAEKAWVSAIDTAEDIYLHLIDLGWSAQEARSVLPNSLKTEIVVTMNIREWRHFFKLRVADGAHPQMRELTRPLLAEMQELIPVVFNDITW